jgi:hypothetical protein
MRRARRARALVESVPAITVSFNTIATAGKLSL